MHRPADPRLQPDPLVRRRGDGGPGRRDGALRRDRRRARRRRRRPPLEDGPRRREAGARQRAVQPRDHRPLRPDAEDLRQARADAARRGRRDPADRRDPGAHGGAGGLRLRVRGDSLRCRHDHGLAEGLGRARARTARTWAQSSARTSAASTSSPEPRRSGSPPDEGRRIVAGLGDVLGGRYRLVELLGQGGMATIYRATDSQLGRDVAVKVLHREYGRDPDFVARFRQEAHAAAALSHPGIVAVLRLRRRRGRARTSSWSSSTARTSRRCCAATGRSRLARRRASWPRSLARSTRPTTAGSSTATSSPATSCSTPTAG